MIRSQFERLHQVLHEEESGRLAALKKEEEEKIAAMKQRVQELSEEMLSVTETISVIQGQLMEDNIDLLKVCPFQASKLFFFFFSIRSNFDYLFLSLFF